ncbi:MAG TPA: enoyl-CoA hydratase-related protein [Burkholderiales bacterium]|nr:enoyl-CoA hydratase-related protein [Burkholderiales bacterium]
MSLPQDAVLLNVQDGIARIRFNRPDALNAIDDALARGFLAACEAVSQRSDVRVVVLSGAGRAFMAGGDLRRMHAAGEAGPLADALLRVLNPALLLLADIPAPVLASVHGAVAGAGVGVALAADLAIAANDTQINLAYTRIGATPDAGTTWELPRLVGLRRALEIALLNDTYDAAEALRLGLVNRIVPGEMLEAETEALAHRLASGATLAYGRAKRLMRASFDATLAQQLDAERDAFVESTRTADFKEGVSALLEKRKPRFSGS